MSRRIQCDRLSDHSIARKKSCEAQDPSNGHPSIAGNRAVATTHKTNEAQFPSMENANAEIDKQRQRRTPSIPQNVTRTRGIVSNPKNDVKCSSRSSTPPSNASSRDSLPIPQQSNLDVDLNEDRRKRKKIISEDSNMSAQIGRTPSLHQQLLSAAFGPTSNANKATTGPSEKPGVAPPTTDNASTKQGSRDTAPLRTGNEQPQADIKVNVPEAKAPLESGRGQDNKVVEARSEVLQARTPPKKMMKLRVDGRLGSPKGPVEPPVKPKRGRKPIVKEKKIVLRYGNDQASKDTIGHRVSAILSGTIRFSRNQPKDDPKASTRQPEPPKETHPFFLGQSKPQLKSQPGNGSQKPDTHSSPRKKPTATVSKPSKPWPTFKSSFHNAKPRSNTSLLAPWPTREMAHVRDLSEFLPTRSVRPSVPLRKLKNPAVRLGPDEDLLVKYTRKMKQVCESAKIEEPTQRILSGVALQRAIVKEIYGNGIGRSSSQPIIHRMLNELPIARSAFDRFECDYQDWAAKYAPKCSADVLQERHLIELFRHWLQGHTVNAVDCGGMREGKPAPKRRKKRRRSSDLDGFVVSTDDDSDVDQPLSLHDTDQETEPLYDHQKPYKTTSLRELTPQTINKTGAVVITGPHGSGKTATVYAVARELEFEVFEINPGSRRSGRDLMDRVGDMTKNHLVTRVDTGDETETPKDDLIEDADHLRNEIESGRQSTMGAFFKPKVVKKPKPVATAKKQKPAAPVPAPKKSKSQRQSLILLEEVDVLFEEDKNFWNTVVSLLVSSRRPIVMTCVDETVLPFDQLDTCSVLQLCAPQSEPAVEYLMLLAAYEGHIISRKAVNQLYGLSADLRYSISQLQFWCQMTLKDPKGGLGWMLPLPGMSTSANTNEEPVRVISEGTYLPITGLLSRNDPTDSDSVQDRYVDLMREAVDEWSYDIEWSEGSIDWSSDKVLSGGSTLNSARRLQNLRLVDSACDVISGADIMPGSRVLNDLAMDPSQDALTDNARFNYTTGYHLLQASVLQDGTSLSKDIVTWLKINTKTSSSDSEASLDREQLCSSIVASANARNALNDACEDLIISLEPLAPFQNDSTDSKPNSILASENRISNIATDFAPYVRSIVSYDIQLEQERLRLSNLLSEGGRPRGKKLRTTRASRAALEGGNKASTRRERWFPTNLNVPYVLSTAGEGWQQALRQVGEKQAREEGIEYGFNVDQMTSSQDSVI